MSRTEHSRSSSRDPDTSIAAPAPRRLAQIGSSLGPVPPTPADWVEEVMQGNPESSGNRDLRIDTSNAAEAHTTTADTIQNSSVVNHANSVSTGGLARTGAKRDSSAKGIRERRSESRAARERVEAQSAVEPSNNPWARDMEAAKPANLVLSSSNGAICQRRNAVKTSPKSAKKYSPLDGQLSARPKKSYGELQTPDSNHFTPHVNLAQRVMSPEVFAPTPPFSPGTEAFEAHARSKASPAVPPKTLPTPPLQRHLTELPVSKSSLPVLSDQSHDRPLSHILHSPNEDVTTLAPLVPSKPASAGLPAQVHKANNYDEFAQSSIDRHRAFIEKEMAAPTDQERLELFAAFIVNESRLRRDRYSTAFDSMASDILDLTRDMWRPYNGAGRRPTTPGSSGPKSAAETWRSRSSTDNDTPSQPTGVSSGPSNASFTPRTEPDSPASASSQTRGRGESQTWAAFQPCLSPIPSMCVSTAHDEEASRGRSPSRWWEDSASGSVGRGGKVQRTKRESKYMGVPREARETLQWYNDRTSPHEGGASGPSNQTMLYGPDEYPLEKVGLHDADGSSPPPQSTPKYHNHSSLTTPDPHKLDVSRLVTLPPPYPRHHPAVNNNHPDLASIRAIHRTLSDFEDATATKEAYTKKTETQREQQKAAADELRSQLRHNIQENIRNGHMTFASAAQAEADFEATQAKRSQELVQSQFESFQAEVFTPLYALFSERITKASASLDHLRASLFSSTHDTDPNQAQEEGDEQPELLEKLTLLKWLFETRQQLHAELFELENLRNDRYKQVVLTPYRAAGNTEKVREAEAFFARDTQDRRVAFETSALRRWEDFLGAVESNVTRGVEVQLSAFWDIAPGLLAVVQRVPFNLEECEVLIPREEYAENPAYHEWPLQYLYSLLKHAEKSAYQFIESQVNLLCLLHEVKTGVVAANSKLLETQRLLAGEDYAAVDREMRDVRRDEDARLTDDLKEKVSVVEGLWEEALGGELRGCRERVEAFLVEQGGWDENLQE
ncbi:hypothetical protein H2201_003283 [Coniosporium apollinis]|uniref:Uncharacterized protein n=1 Tax=Coniosporium apollinis TaxID=61459 RepID=A0ABQ9NW55_9PEZI|nr:hypothetical protein H2201_003283 [Coniosporium apollinis]